MKIPKSILLIGGTSGIGLETFRLLGKYDCSIVLVGRDFSKFKELDPVKNSVRFIEHDFTDLNFVDEFITKIGDVNFDGIVFSLGVNAIKPIKFINYAHLLDVFNINVFSFQLIISKLYKSKLISDGASIVGLGSIASELNELGSLAYSSSKAAFISSVKVMAKELSRNNIRVNAVLPGAVESRMNEKLGFTYERSPNIFDSLLGLGRITDISQVILFLLSSHSKWQTGSMLTVDGGQSI